MATREEMINSINITKGNEAINRVLVDTWDERRLELFYNSCIYNLDRRSPWEFELAISTSDLPIYHCEIDFQAAPDLPPVTALAWKADASGRIVPTSIYAIALLVLGEIRDYDIACLQNTYNIISAKYNVYPFMIIVGKTMSPGAAKYISMYDVQVTVRLKQGDLDSLDAENACIDAAAPMIVEHEMPAQTYLYGQLLSEITTDFIRCCRRLSDRKLKDADLLRTLSYAFGYIPDEYDVQEEIALEALSYADMSVDDYAVGNNKFVDDYTRVDVDDIKIYGTKLDEWSSRFLSLCEELTTAALTDEKKFLLLEHAYDYGCQMYAGHLDHCKVATIALDYNRVQIKPNLGNEDLEYICAECGAVVAVDEADKEKGTSFCAHCGTQYIVEYAKYTYACSVCGTDVLPTKQEIKSGHFVCDHCNTILDTINYALKVKCCECEGTIALTEEEEESGEFTCPHCGASLYLGDEDDEDDEYFDEDSDDEE